jgi:hypothetical protein
LHSRDTTEASVTQINLPSRVPQWILKKDFKTQSAMLLRTLLEGKKIPAGIHDSPKIRRSWLHMHDAI